tara:strand:+ start:206 stop:634 length:429 start_codon:yes stop_codon:yes gene_type:complete
MEQYKYGPLLYNTSESDNESGNYYWNGLAPVGYDRLGIPIDAKGYQCLDSQQCPIHPAYEVSAENLEHNEFLGVNIPTLSCFNTWFADQFLEVTDRDLALFVLRWIDLQKESEPCSQAVYSKCATMHLEEILDLIWPSTKVH